MSMRAGLIHTRMALCAGMLLAQSGCGEHVLVVTLENLSAEATSISTYYRIDQDSFRSTEIAAGQLPASGAKFGIRPPEGRSGTLDVQVLAYKDSLPCALNKGITSADVGGSGPIDATTVLDQIPFSPCRANDAPVSYPVDAKVWASAPNNVWIAGKDSVVLHWDGSLFRNIPIADSVLGNPKPSFRAIRGDGQGNLWLASDAPFVVRIAANGSAVRIPIQLGATGSSTAPLVYNGVYADAASAWIVGTRNDPTSGLIGGFVGKYDAARSEFVVTETDRLPGISSSYPLFGVDCASSTDCWFVGTGLVLRALNGSYQEQLIYSDGTTCTFKSSADLRAVYANSDISLVKMIGASGRYVFYNGKCFNSATQDAAMRTIGSDLVSMSAHTSKDLIVVGSNALYRWKGSAPEQLFPTELSPWQSVVSLSAGFFVTAQTGRIFYAPLSP